eukprot:TRINITY_DN4390_c1_g2_i1.p1 TRINITY_DN4390_c1_g2~~TRINITY_DN4390_c1_g2_i1.p1  ORF type:complete len:1150 (-),score=169.16 TRINITY_DN4390_c1_g2_i1:36-3011(-)
MYAAIASRSIGTRLLTSFARLSLPNRRNLERIKVPLVFSFENVKNSIFGRRKAANATGTGCAASGSGVGSVVRDGSGTGLDLEAPLSCAAYSNLGTVQSPEAGTAEEDDEQHFRKFLQELPRWLSYDICSRLCMSFGMNQMLQALSYYVLGTIWLKSRASAVMSFFAVKMLSILVLWLDVGDHAKSVTDAAALVILHFAPPLFGAFLLSSATSKSGTFQSLLATLCFWGHAGWLWYLSSITDRAGTRFSSFKPAEFSNVLEWVQQNPVRKDLIARVRAAREEVEHEMADIERDEVTAGDAAALRARNDDKLDSLLKMLLQACAEVMADDTDPSQHAELVRADQTLKRLTVWTAAPEILAALQSLRLPKVAEKFTSRENASVNEAYQSFLQLCQDYDLGLWKQLPDDRSGSSSWWRKSPKPALTARPLAPGEECIVCVERTSGNGVPVWIHPRISGEANDTAANSVREIRLKSILQEEFPRWKASLAQLKLEASSTPEACSSVPASEKARAGSCTKSARMRSRPPVIVDGGPSPGHWTNPESREETAPPDELPARVVHFFSMGLVGWWCIAGITHATVVLTERESTLQRLASGASTLPIEWPEHGNLFTVDSLFCRNSKIWVSDGFSVYVGTSSLSALLENATESYTFREAREGPIRGMICKDDDCEAIGPIDGQGRWQATPTAWNGQHAHAPRMLPSSWRRVAGEWTGINTATLAVWDGTTVFVVSSQMPTTAPSIASHLASIDDAMLHVRFSLDPAIGRCPGGLQDCKALMQEEQVTYDDVRSMQMLHGGRALVVLLSKGIVDFWDLERGIVHERLFFGKNYSSMCQSGRHLIFAEDESVGPALVAVPLSQAAVKLLQGSAEVKSHIKTLKAFSRRQAKAVNTTVTTIEPKVTGVGRSTSTSKVVVPAEAVPSEAHVLTVPSQVTQGYRNRSQTNGSPEVVASSLVQTSLRMAQHKVLRGEDNGCSTRLDDLLTRRHSWRGNVLSDCPAS